VTVELALVLVGLAVVDSINPSALVVAAVVLTKSRPEHRVPGLLAYVAGIFVSYLALGLVVLAGIDGVLSLARDLADSRAVLIGQAVAGGLLLLYAVLAPATVDARKRRRRDELLQRSLRPALLFGYGAYVTVVELVTALPYFAALALLGNAAVPFPVAALVLIGYCLVFVAPPLGVAVLYRRRRERIDAWVQRRGEKADGRSRETLLWIAGIAGFLLLSRALAGLWAL
jgi:hypothetical protein